MKKLFLYLLSTTMLLNQSCTAQPQPIEKEQKNTIYLYEIDKSFKEVQKMIDHSTNTTLERMKLFTGKKTSLVPTFKASSEISGMTSALTGLVDELRNEIINQSGGTYVLDEEGKPERMEARGFTIERTSKPELDGKLVAAANTEIPLKILYTESKLEEINELIRKLRKMILGKLEEIIVDVNESKIEGVQFNERDLERMKYELIELLDSDIFKSLTVAESLVVLNKIKTDALTSVFKSLSYVSVNIGLR